MWDCGDDMGVDLRLGDCLEIMKQIPDKTNIQFNLTTFSLLAIIKKNGGYYGKK